MAYASFDSLCLRVLEDLQEYAYLVGRPRVVVQFNYQGKPDYLEAWVDSDYAGCRRTRKSTSGGAIMMGGHIIKVGQGFMALR